MNKYDICCVGHITLDKIVTPKHTVHMPEEHRFISLTV